MPTRIAWTDESWNPVTGCTKVSTGCAHCYIERTPPMRMAGRRFVDGRIPVELYPDRLEIPLRWRKPRMVFVPSMGDLFHEDVPDGFIEQVWLTMHKASGHTFQVLTKRPERMRRWMKLWLADQDGNTSPAGTVKPLPNIWLGVSVENQARADERIPLLLETPAAVRFVSLEPLLGPLKLTRYLRTVKNNPTPEESVAYCDRRIDWVIVGGESGGPPERRLVERCHCYGHNRIDTGEPYPACTYCDETRWMPRSEALAWVRKIRDDCQAAGVPFFFKQWGPRAGQGALLDGRGHKEMPEVRA